MAVVTELGSDVDPLVLHLDAALAEKECALISAHQGRPCSRQCARNTVLGNPALAAANRNAVAERAEICARRSRNCRLAIKIRSGNPRGFKVGSCFSVAADGGGVCECGEPPPKFPM